MRLAWALARRVSEWIRRNFAEANRRASPVGSYCPGSNETPDGWSTGNYGGYRSVETLAADDGVSLDALQTDGG